jgi:phenylpropionate dioxygenase-like ring-hydroxylating dioxygenase large terminal subunit
MQHDVQVQLTKEVFQHLDAKTTALAPEMMRNPTAVYTDRDILKNEREKLFRGMPNFMGLSSRLPNPGDFVTEDFTGVPILMIRTPQGEVKAFLNICRHRGAKVANGCGNSKRSFVCPYHAWSYDHHGKLLSIPHGENFADLDKSSHGLVALPTVEKDGMIWVHADPKAEIDIDSHLGGLSAEFANYGLADYHHYETRSLSQKMNWKAVIDTFLEPYHFAFLHANTVGPIFVPNLCLFDAFGHNLREVLPRRTITQMREQPEADWDLVYHTALVYVLFPNTVFVMQADHAETWRVYPVANNADECVTYLDFYTPEPADTDSAKRHWDRNMDLTIRTVAEEDFPTGEGIQFGYGANAQDAVTFGRNEPALIHFQKSITAALADALAKEG